MDQRVSQIVSPNPLLEDWDAPYGLPPFDAIRAEHFVPALQVAMQANRAELDALAAQVEPPSFDNTIAAFDRCARQLGRIEAVFYNLTASHTSPELQAVQREMAAPLSAHYSAVFMHAGLFKRVDALHAQRETLGLTPEQRRLLERTHLDFVRSGARFGADAQARYAQVMERLAELTTRFAQNVLHDEATDQLLLQGEADLAGLPGFVRDAARQAASERGLAEGHVITLSRSLIVPFLTFSERRDLREQRPGAPGSAAASTRASTTTGRWRAPSSSCVPNRPRCTAIPAMPTSRSPTPWRARARRCTSCSTTSGRARWRRWHASARNCSR